MSNPAAAGALRTLLGMKEPGQPGRIVVWDTEEIVAGRSPECDIVVEDPDASRRHALFSRTAAGFHVEDLGTPNGTFVNDQPLGGTHTLEVKDTVKVDPSPLALSAVNAPPIISHKRRLMVKPSPVPP